MTTAPEPLVIVVSGPSGVGKNVVCERLFEEDESLVHSVSTTTRPPRKGEVDGKDYHFVAEAAFREGIEKDAFLEWAEVFGNLYGTSREFIAGLMEMGLSPVLNIDVQGGRSIKRALPEALLVFLMPPDFEALEKRLRGRGTDREDRLQVRLATAKKEIEQAEAYDHVVVNDDLDRAVAEVRALIQARRASPQA